MRPSLRVGALGCVVATAILTATAAPQLDAPAARWVASTLEGMTLDQKIGQLIMPSFRSTYLSSDSTTYDELVSLVHEQHVGGFLLFAGREPAPDVLLGAGYARGVPGQPLAAASITNRLQAIAALPLLNAADFETGVGFRIGGATTFPRAMAFGAADDEGLAFEAGRITAVEARALGIHVNFAPVADVNNNPRNPVINTRSFGEDPVVVARLAAAYVRGLTAGGMVATVKHFPGHGDTDVDSHLGLPLIAHPRERLDRVELPPFRAGIDAGAGAVMTSHIVLPGLEPDPARPATFSRQIVSGLLREELGFDGLVYTDSMRMRAVTDLAAPGDAAVDAVGAGHDVVIHSPDDTAVFNGLKAAVEQGRITEARVEASVRRLLEAKARLGLHRTRAVSLDTLPLIVGTRAHEAVAAEVSRRGMTLIKDERDDVPLRAPRRAAILYLSVLDYPSGWGNGVPSRTFLSELEQRWPNVTAVEVSDRTSPDELELLRASIDRYDAVVASVFVRTASFSGRMDLAEGLIELLRSVARRSEARRQPFVTVFFGNPYAATFLPELPAMLLTYDFYDLAEASAVRAIAGEAPIGGRLPIALGEQFPVGHGLVRTSPVR
ncbi:MAG TPA: glycoside hydrolase family 3 N-terminal domain-containing protein [Vicinamibacterales bacterium]|nr:glycoside hydrolase family 3 N-terminal domain-containing protein [Vicinamibacterales bacterium]